MHKVAAAYTFSESKKGAKECERQRDSKPEAEQGQ